MQAKIVRKVPKTEARNYLRVASISNKSILCYLYIGNDKKSFNFLSENFTNGIAAKNFDEAKNLINEKILDKIDVIILDVIYDERKVRDFYSFLKNRELHTIPIIYNERFAGLALKYYDGIDDIIDLDNWQFDLSNKITFIRKSKEYNFLKSGISTYRIAPTKSMAKRAFDLIIASLLLIMLLPLFLIIALAIKIESKGPVFYNAKRAGKGFKIFSFYKFRTMVVNADKKIQELTHLNQYNGSASSALFFKISNDPRITKVGRFLRNTSMDELPQLFNVLKGDMSLVGNRPLPLYEAATLTTNEFVERFMAPAGITGLWQIKKRGKANMSTEERIGLDILYVRKSNLLYDLWIMAHTPNALIQKDNV